MRVIEGARVLPGPLPTRPRRGRALPTLVAAVCAGLLLGRFVVTGRDQLAPASPPSAGRGTAAAISDLQDRLRADPDDPALLTRLGVAYLTQARETADPAYFTKAAEALDRSHAQRADDRLTLTGLGLLALSRHDFRAALEWGTRAHDLDPASADPLGVIVDAQVELGRYDEAAASAQQMLDRRPSLASLARASYLRELHGDVPGAVTAMTQASVAGAGSAADVAYVETLLGDLELGRHEFDRADAAYRRALDRVEAYSAATVGRAKVAAAEGRLTDAAAMLADATARLPLPASVALLGDVQAALGRADDAKGQYELVRQIEQLNRANGVAVDLELARFEADHARDGDGRPEAAVAQARAALAERPTVYAEDTLGWALRQAGQADEALPHARAAVRLGTADATLWYHLASVEADLGMTDDARGHLDKALAINAALTMRDLPAARALAGRLGVGR